MTQASLFDAGMTSEAAISQCGTYRYMLLRSWDTSLPRCSFAMLNPSVADHTIDDPTVRRCIGYAKSWGYGSLLLVNLFSLRSTDPAALKSHPDPVGPENDASILHVATHSSLVVAAWGAQGTLHGRADAVRAMLRRAGVPLMCLARTKGGEPGHPLYLGGGLKPVPMEATP